MVVNAAGIGDKVNETFLREIVGKCRGTYIHVRDLGQLASWYSELARNLRMVGAVKSRTPDESAGANGQNIGTATGGPAPPPPDAQVNGKGNGKADGGLQDAHTLVRLLHPEREQSIYACVNCKQRLRYIDAYEKSTSTG